MKFTSSLRSNSLLRPDGQWLNPLLQPVGDAFAGAGDLAAGSGTAPGASMGFAILADASPFASNAYERQAIGEVLVQFCNGLPQPEREAAIAAVGGRILEVVLPEGIRAGEAETTQGPLLRVQLEPEMGEDEAIAILSASAGVDFAEPNWIVSVEAISNDPGYAGGSLWGMYGDATATRNIFGSQAGEAWALGAIGSSKVVVGVIDTGIDYTHIDLYLNVWLNQSEIPLAFRGNLSDTDSDGLITLRDLNDALNAAFVSDLDSNGRIDARDLLADMRWENGADDDGNGYLDDLIGWDFANGDNDPFDDNGHGTHVSGTIGATGGNGTGVAGVAWNVQIMALKFLRADGSGAIANAVKAVDYYTAESKTAVGENFIATNNSWGGGGVSSAMQAAIDRAAAADILFVAAAGNSAINTDTTANYPSNYSTLASAGYEAVISVAALTSTGGLASFSNYGARTVDLAAPGAGIYSTLPNESYGTLSGTSMAAPHVTGALALYAAQNGAATAATMRDALLGSTIATSSVSAKTVTGGRLDAEAMRRYVPVAGIEIYGTNAADTLLGTAGADVICGITQTGTGLGTGTVDVLTGLGGRDVFILGDARGIFYNDGNARSAGTGDYARIMDFQLGDKIQLSNDVATYFLRAVKIGTFNGTGIYADTDNNGAFGRTDELVGHVANVTSLLSSDLIFA